MKLNDVWKRSDVFIATVPLAIDAYGFAYLNDIGVMNITINTKHRSMLNCQIECSKLKQLIVNARNDIKQKDTLASIQNELLKVLEAYSDDITFTF